MNNHEPTLIADYALLSRIFTMAVCDSPAAPAMALSVAPSARIARIASSLRSVASRAFLAQEATSLAVIVAAEPEAFPELRGTTPACPRTPGRPAAGTAGGPSPGLLRHVGDVPGGVVRHHLVDGVAGDIPAGATGLEARQGSGLGGGNCGDGGGVSGHLAPPFSPSGELWAAVPPDTPSKPCFQPPVNIVSKKEGRENGDDRGDL